MKTNPKKTVKNSLALFTALFGCSMTLATMAPVYALSRTSVTHTPTLSSSLISKEATPTTTTEIETTSGFPSYKSVLKKYSPEQRKRLLNILNSEEAKNTNSVEELGKLIGDDNLTTAIRKDTSGSSQASKFPWNLVLNIILQILIAYNGGAGGQLP